MQDYHSIFEQELKRLNPEQRKAAVELLEGPVMVIAGPGTGKTQILSARIGVLLSSPNLQVEPHNILCLTFTDAGAVAMRQRLLKFIGPTAHRVNITTFHAFCNQIIQEHPELFGNKIQQPLSDLESIKMFEDLIDSFDDTNPLKRYKGDTYFEMKRLRTLFETMKKESWSLEQITEECSKYARESKNSIEFVHKRGPQKGQFNEKKFNDFVDRLKKTVYAARQFSVFEEMKAQLGRYDYTDMIYWVIDALKKNSSLLSDYQERYQYLLVDEYQDTSGAQNELLYLLCSYWENPNLFVVGDEDQSIYRFQGANVYNIMNFHERFREYLNMVVLKKNYRSTQLILDNAGAVINNNHERLTDKIPGLDKNLKADNREIADKDFKPEVIQFMNATQEELFIVNELTTMYEKNQDLSEVAVIYRKHRHTDNIIRILQRRGIPLNIRRKLDVLELPLIKNLISLLTYLWREYKKPDSAEDILYEILHYEFFNLETQDIHTLLRTISGPQKRLNSDTLLDFENTEHDKEQVIPPPTWRQLMADEQRLLELPLRNMETIRALEFNLSYWQKAIPNITIQALFEKILTNGGVLQHIMLGADTTWDMQVISTFFDFIKEETAREPDMTLGDVLDQIRMLRKYDLTIPLQQYVQSEKGVNFVTAHSSKGLEYKKVFILRCNANQWENARDPGASMQYLIPPGLLNQTLGDDALKLEEERRLFYVALTRAKEELVITFPQFDHRDKPLTESMFVSELISEGKSVKKYIQMPDEEILAFRMDLMSEEQRPVIELAEESFLRERLQNFAMTVTHLNKYLECPLSFYFENILKVPAARSENSGFGNAIHKALQELFSEMIEKHKKFPSKEFFMHTFKKSMHYYQSHFTRKEFDLRTTYGMQVLADYYDHYLAKWNTNVSLELELRNIEVDGIPVKGKLDKIEYLDGDKVAVVDYKTGKVNKRKAEAQVSPPNEEQPLGGNYWRQIVFYRLLLDNFKRKRMQMVYGEIDFVEKDKDSKFYKAPVVVSEGDVRVVKQQLKDSYTRIMNLEFNTGCGKPNCTWCNFVKNNYRGDALSFETEEWDNEGGADLEDFGLDMHLL